MPRDSDPPPTRDELKKAIPDLFYAASQAASFGYLGLIEEEESFIRLREAMPNVDHVLNTAFLELSLLFIRKTTEFFKPPGNGDKDGEPMGRAVVEPACGLHIRNDRTETHRIWTHEFCRIGRVHSAFRRHACGRLQARSLSGFMEYSSEEDFFGKVSGSR
jgi:hypothetical protein